MSALLDSVVNILGRLSKNQLHAVTIVDIIQPQPISVLYCTASLQQLNSCRYCCRCEPWLIPCFACQITLLPHSCCRRLRQAQQRSCPACQTSNSASLTKSCKPSSCVALVISHGPYASLIKSCKPSSHATHVMSHGTCASSARYVSLHHVWHTSCLMCNSASFPRSCKHSSVLACVT